MASRVAIRRWPAAMRWSRAARRSSSARSKRANHGGGRRVGPADSRPPFLPAPAGRRREPAREQLLPRLHQPLQRVIADRSSIPTGDSSSVHRARRSRPCVPPQRPCPATTPCRAGPVQSQTASAASIVHGAAKAARRRNRRCLSGDNTGGSSRWGHRASVDASARPFGSREELEGSGRDATDASARRREKASARRGRLDGQGQPVEPRADDRHRRRRCRRLTAKRGATAARVPRRERPTGTRTSSSGGAAVPSRGRRQQASPRTLRSPERCRAVRLVTSIFSRGAPRALSAKAGPRSATRSTLSGGAASHGQQGGSALRQAPARRQPRPGGP